MITNLSEQELADLIREAGGKPFQARQLEHWIYKQGASDYAACENLPNRLLEALAAHGPLLQSSVEDTVTASDGTQKSLIRLADQETIETVLIPRGEHNTLCISTQVGCPVGCIFCASGLNGVRRNLQTGEIVEQVLHARRHSPSGRQLTNLVVMGIGEPLLNLANLLPALDRIHDPDGINMGARRITVSTSGFPAQMDQLATTPHSFNLAVSLHSADEELRKRLVPATTATVSEILDAAHRYFSATGRQITFEVVLLSEVNDRARDAELLVRRLRTMPCTVNVLPWNPVEQIPDLDRPPPFRVDKFVTKLREGGLNVTVRKQRGADRSAACGQLRILSQAPSAS
ncbi:MAG: 23S rRNA (adenine(2503)-C(2))-methyltransferase RlmN [Planctomycetota bacterium]|nr:23S rRNA (adenine(2503)-C(2))-methyltransferase RlmN [Planctomycetota bacterium]